MAALLTLATLAKWTQSDEADVIADPFAAEVIEKASKLICHLGGHDGTVIDPETGYLLPEWTLDLGPEQAPIDVQMVALQLIKRSYENPGRVLHAGSIGPIGGDRVADIQAMFMELTDAERRTITRHNPNGDPDAEHGGGLYTISTDTSEAYAPSAYGYVGDDQQINLDISADPREWMIPMFNPGDPGS